ncbi:hypothetical protein [Bradyrhizobium cosmicum]|uniref:hypothetical protein n=1 Tax=Bradyrhizobium cosmicum TaxID=1404864 RepID=UPI001161D944|nr:hypothetical protein [Bradyrhizobium cosmicum]QDP21187.1 hypothetical protein FNV92_02975 [Bradyrhizobium cosmicum]
MSEDIESECVQEPVRLPARRTTSGGTSREMSKEISKETSKRASRARTLTDIDSSPHSLRKRVQLVDLRRRMGSLHEALRNAKR